MFSFHPVKAITTAEGGVITTRDAELRDRLVSFRSHGLGADAASRRMLGGPWWYEQDELGFNYRLSDLHSALGSSQLSKLEHFIERRNAVADRYRRAFSELPGIRLPPTAPGGSVHAYHLFVVAVEDGPDARHRLYSHLRENDVLCQVHYIPVYWHPYYRRHFGYRRGLCPAAEAYYATTLSLPCYPALTESDQNKVIKLVGEGLGSDR